MNHHDREERYGLPVFPKRDLTLVRGEGALVWDDEGRRYIDCIAGIGVASIGHANPVVADALAAQARTLVTCPGIFYNDKRAQLMEKLAAIAPEGLDRVFLCNSGAEAVEAAIKFARLSTGRSRIVAAMRGFHGRTMGALSATHKKDYREPFEPLVPDFVHVPFDNVEKLEEALTDECAALLLEPVQGEGGVRIPHPGYLASARRICDAAGALLVFDEVQTGFCRTGRMFACEHSGVRPDMLCLAKAIAGGVPMGALLCGGRVEPAVGRHGTTFGGNPLACAASLAAIAYMEDEGLARQAEEKGQYFEHRFSRQRPARVRALRRAGLMIGIELRERARPHIARLAEEGVLALPAGPTVIRLLPPLVIEHEDLDRVSDALHAILGP